MLLMTKAALSTYSLLLTTHDHVPHDQGGTLALALALALALPLPLTLTRRSSS